MWSRTAGVSLTCWLSEIWVEDCCGFDSSVRFTPSENQATVMGSVWGVMTSPEGTCVSAHTQYSVLETYLPPFWSVSETSFANYSHASFERTAHLSYRKSTVQNPCLFGTISVWIQRKTKQGKTCEKHHVSHLIPCDIGWHGNVWIPHAIMWETKLLFSFFICCLSACRVCSTGKTPEIMSRREIWNYFYMKKKNALVTWLDVWWD